MAVNFDILSYMLDDNVEPVPGSRPMHWVLECPNNNVLERNVLPH